MDLTISALEKGLKELEDGTEGSFLSKHVDVHRIVQMGHNMLSSADSKMLEKAILSSPDYKKLEFNEKYTMRSGKIQELIADMLQTFKDNLDEAKEKEKDAKAQYEKLKATKEDQLSSAKETLSSLGGETASREEAVAEAEGEVSDLED